MEIIDILNWINSQQINERLINIQAVLSTLNKDKEFPWIQLVIALPSFITMAITIWVAIKTAKNAKEIANLQTQTSKEIAEIQSQTSKVIAETQVQTSKDIAEAQVKTSKDIAQIQAQASKETANLVAEFNRELKDHDYRLAYMKEIIQRRVAAYDKLLDYIEKYFDDDFFPDGSFNLRFSSIEKVEAFFNETQKMSNSIDLLRYETVQIFMMTMFAGAYNLHTKAKELDEHLRATDSEYAEELAEINFHRALEDDISSLRGHMFNLRSKAHEDLLVLHDVDEYKREIELRRSNRQSSE